MKILMLGWEFPPVFSGGLGVVTKSLAISLGKRGLEICFALPYFIRRTIPESQIPGEFSLIDFKDFVHKISFELFPTLISSPYISPRKYTSDIEKVTEEELREMDLEYFSQTQSGAVYGKNLFEEIDRFAKQMEIFARGRKFDLIHAHDWITFEAGIRLKPILNIPLLLHVHVTEIDRTGGNPDRKSTRLNSSHIPLSRMPSSA